ncbi:MAG: hypothetical protein AAGF98_03880 [Cyanobacteria bacterium P01_H01_bin.153]
MNPISSNVGNRIQHSSHWEDMRNVASVLSALGELVLTSTQANRLSVEPYRQISPYLKHGSAFVEVGCDQAIACELTTLHQARFSSSLKINGFCHFKIFTDISTAKKQLFQALFQQTLVAIMANNFSL